MNVAFMSSFWLITPARMMMSSFVYVSLGTRSRKCLGSSYSFRFNSVLAVSWCVSVLQPESLEMQSPDCRDGRDSEWVIGQDGKWN
jgi:hypothetical protein